MNCVKKINEKIERIDKKWEFAIVCILSAFLIFGVILGMGTLTSGYHLVDDHEFLKWTYQIKCQNQGLWKIIKQESAKEFINRYRPLYIVIRILLCKVFGINLTKYSLLKALETWCTCVCLYYCGKLLGADKVYSFLFAVMSLLGYQSAVWWKLGTHEIQGTLLFAAGFYCMLKWLLEKKWGWAAGSIVLFFIMCNYKESFILLLPFLMLYVVYFDLKEKNVETTWNNTWKSIKDRFWYLLVLGIIFLILILIIIFFVGVNDYDKVGLDASVPVSVYMEALQDSFANDLKWYKRFGILFVLILLTYWEELKKLWKEILLTAAFLLPQFVIFGQAGIGERYILPSSIGFSLFFVIIIPKWRPLSGKRRVVYVLGLLLLLAAHGRVALREADYFRYRGQSVNTMLETVKELSGEDTKVLSCFRPNEEGNLTINYWMLVHGYDNVYFWTEEEALINKVCDLNLYYPEEYYEPQSFEDMDIVVMYNQEDRHWCYTPTLDLSDFTEMKCGTLTIYVRNDSGITPADTDIEGLRINF